MNRADTYDTDVEIYRRPGTKKVLAESRSGAPEHLLWMLDALGLERTDAVAAGPPYVRHLVPEHLTRSQEHEVASRAVPSLLAAGYRVGIADSVWDEAAYRSASAENPQPAAGTLPADERNLADAYGTDVEITHRDGRVCADTRSDVDPRVHRILRGAGFIGRTQSSSTPNVYELPLDYRPEQQQLATTRAALLLHGGGFKIHVTPELFRPPSGSTIPVPTRPAATPVPVPRTPQLRLQRRAR